MGADADLVRRLTEEGFLKGNPGIVDELLADDFVSHDPPPGVSGDKEGQRQIIALVSSAFSDMRMEFDEMIDTADGRVVENWAMSGVHSGEAFGVPPSNQRVRVRGVEIWRCADGRIAENWAAVDMSDFFEKAMGAGG
jgi:steroid delta-isomerase-like uncharacterized protein